MTSAFSDSKLARKEVAVLVQSYRAGERAEDSGLCLQMQRASYVEGRANVDPQCLLTIPGLQDWSPTQAAAHCFMDKVYC